MSAAAIAGTALSLVPAVALPDDTSTAVTLGAAHLVAAALVIPAIGARLPAGDAR